MTKQWTSLKKSNFWLNLWRKSTEIDMWVFVLYKRRDNQLKNLLFEIKSNGGQDLLFFLFSNMISWKKWLPFLPLPASDKRLFHQLHHPPLQPPLDRYIYNNPRGFNTFILIQNVIKQPLTYIFVKVYKCRWWYLNFFPSPAKVRGQRGKSQNSIKTTHKCLLIAWKSVHW